MNFSANPWSTAELCLLYSKDVTTTKLKEKAAKFLTQKFQDLYYHPGMAVQQPRACRLPKHTSKWKLPNLFGEYIVTNRVLPLGFTSVETPPDPSR